MKYYELFNNMPVSELTGIFILNHIIRENKMKIFFSEHDIGHYKKLNNDDAWNSDVYDIGNNIKRNVSY